MATVTYSEELGCLGQVLQRLQASIIHCKHLEVDKFFEELLVILSQMGDLQLIQNEVAEL